MILNYWYMEGQGIYCVLEMYPCLSMTELSNTLCPCVKGKPRPFWGLSWQWLPQQQRNSSSLTGKGCIWNPDWQATDSGSFHPPGLFCKTVPSLDIPISVILSAITLTQFCYLPTHTTLCVTWKVLGHVQCPNNSTVSLLYCTFRPVRAGFVLV